MIKNRFWNKFRFNTKRYNKGIKRRTFIRNGAIFTGVLGLTFNKNCIFKKNNNEDSQKSLQSKIEVKKIPTTCRMCESLCAINTYIKDEQIIYISGNDNSQNNGYSGGRICAKGHAGIQKVYDQDRIHYPLRRTGKRGSGQWKKISWKTALKEISKRLKHLTDNKEYEKFCIIDGDKYTSKITESFMKSFGSSSYLINDYDGQHSTDYMKEKCFGKHTSIPDILNSDFILNFGANQFVSDKHLASISQRLSDFIDDGKTLINFDVRLTETASKSSEYYIVKPASDLTIILAMIFQILLDKDLNGKIDKNFVNTWTNTSITELTDYFRFSNYSPEWAEIISGISADIIKNLSSRFIKSKNPLILFGSGISAHTNSIETIQAIYTLQALSGNVNKKGGLNQYIKMGWKDPISDLLQDEKINQKLRNNKKLSLFDNSLNEQNSRIVNHKTIFEHLLKNNLTDNIKLLITHKVNPVYEDYKIKDILKDELIIPFYVSVCTNFDETSMMADLILPEATFLESFNLFEPDSFNLQPFLQIQQPVIKALGESKSYTDMIFNLASKIKELSEYFTYTNEVEYFDDLFNKNIILKENQAFKKLKEKGIFEIKKNIIYDFHKTELDMELINRYEMIPIKGIIYDREKLKSEIYGFSNEDSKAYVGQEISIIKKIPKKDIKKSETANNDIIQNEQFTTEYKYVKGFIPGKFPKSGLIELKLQHGNIDLTLNFPKWKSDFPEELYNLYPNILALVSYSSLAHTTGMTENCKYLAELEHENFAFINKDTANKLKIKDLEEITISNNIITKEIKCKIDSSISPFVIAITKDLGHEAIGFYASGKSFNKFNLNGNSQKKDKIWWKNHGININDLYNNFYDIRSKQLCYLSNLVNVKKKSLY